MTIYKVTNLTDHMLTIEQHVLRQSEANKVIHSCECSDNFENELKDLKSRKLIDYTVEGNEGIGEVTSVNGKTGDVTLTYTDLSLGDASLQPASAFATAAQGTKADSALQAGANVSVLTNDAGYLTSAPVDSVAGKTGAVTLVAADVTDLGTAATTDATAYATAAQGAAAMSALQPGDQVSALFNDANYITEADLPDKGFGVVSLINEDLSAAASSATLNMQSYSLPVDIIATIAYEDASNISLSLSTASGSINLSYQAKNFAGAALTTSSGSGVAITDTPTAIDSAIANDGTGRCSVIVVDDAQHAAWEIEVISLDAGAKSSIVVKDLAKATPA